MNGERCWDRFAFEAEEIKAIARQFDEDMRRLEEELRQNRQRREQIRRQIEAIKFTLCQDLVPSGASISCAAERVGLWALQNWKRGEEARKCYMEHTGSQTLQLPSALSLDPWPPQLSAVDWLALAVDFELLTPWYSRDDRLFHVLDNPVRKDRVFGVPYMSAASWKGMLRWGCRMQAGLQKHLEQGRQFEDWRDPDWILHLFGNEKGEEKKFHQGALVFYPTWFDKIGFEVINPHDRSRRAGTQPIYYEVAPGRRPKNTDNNTHEEGGKGALRVLYAPWPGMNVPVPPAEWLPTLLQAIENLLTQYGISAKRTVGWGTAEIKKWRAWKKDTPDGQPIEADSREDLLKELLPNSGGAS